MTEPAFPPGPDRAQQSRHARGQHVTDHPDTPAMVPLSAHGGGRDGVERTSRAGPLAGGTRLDEITAQARALVAAGRGRERC